MSREGLSKKQAKKIVPKRGARGETASLYRASLANDLKLIEKDHLRHDSFALGRDKEFIREQRRQYK